MATKTKIEIDKCAALYAAQRWEQLTGKSAASCVLLLSSGKTPSSLSSEEAKKNLDLLMGKVNEMAPSVRLSSSEGESIRSDLSAWYRHLHHQKKEMLRKQKVVYLTAAVNAILDEKSFTAFRCNNEMITVFLHHLSAENFQPLEPAEIAEFIIKYSGSFWSHLTRNYEKTTVSLQLSTTTKSKGSRKATTKKKPGKEKTNIEIAESLLLFPHVICAGSSTLLNDVKNDLRVIEEFCTWSKTWEGKDFTIDYQRKYEQFLMRLKTYPKKKAITPSHDFTTENLEKLKSFMLTFAGNDETGLSFFNQSYNQTAMKQLASLPNFDELFRELVEYSKNQTFVSNLLRKMRELKEREMSKEP